MDYQDEAIYESEPTPRGALSKVLQIGGGFAIFGALGTGLVAAGGEIVDQIVSNGDNFPGGPLGKLAGGLALTGLTLVACSEATDAGREVV